MKPQPVAISIGSSEYKGTNYPIFSSYGDFSCIVEQKVERLSLNQLNQVI
jgi:hypothetical protein